MIRDKYDLQSQGKSFRGLESFGKREKPSSSHNKALTIIMENENRESDDYHWVFYETDQGQKAGCMTSRPIVYKGPTFHGANIVFPGNPGGEYDMTLAGRGCKSELLEPKI